MICTMMNLMTYLEFIVSTAVRLIFISPSTRQYNIVWYYHKRSGVGACQCKPPCVWHPRNSSLAPLWHWVFRGMRRTQDFLTLWIPEWRSPSFPAPALHLLHTGVPVQALLKLSMLLMGQPYLWYNTCVQSPIQQRLYPSFCLENYHWGWLLRAPSTGGHLGLTSSISCSTTDLSLAVCPW